MATNQELIDAATAALAALAARVLQLAVPAPAPAPTPVPAPAPAPSPATVWSLVCAEYVSFDLGAMPQKVRFGTGTTWVEKDMTGIGQCTVGFFGADPLPGAAKVCQVLVPPAPAPAPAPAPGPATAAPNWTGVAGPGFVAAPRGVGKTLSIDFGSANGAPTGYDVQLLRNGGLTPIAVATNVTAFDYVTVSTDAGTVLSAVVVARNAIGPSAPFSIPGVVIP